MTRAAFVVLLLCTASGLLNQASAQHEMPGGTHAGMRWLPTVFVLAEKFEMAPVTDERMLTIDGIGWYGNDRTRLWGRVESEINTADFAGEAEFELSYGKLVTPFFDRLIGIRIDYNWGEESATRALLAAGLQGLAPNWFELAAFAYLSQDGDLSARLEAAYDVLFTQRVVFEPRLEVDASAARVPEFGIGSGITNLELGGRLRYEFSKKLAPYMGVNWERQFGGTADFAREAGEPVSSATFVAGLRAWY